TMKDAVDRMAIGLNESNQKADMGIRMAGETNERVLSVAAEAAEGIQRVERKIDATTEQMRAVSEQRAVDNQQLSDKMDKFGGQITSSTARIHTVTANLRAAYFEVDEN